jgi:hypothetical protein
MDTTRLSDADLAYVRANFRPLAEVCAERGQQVERVQALIVAHLLPAPSYVLPDGTEMVPADHFALVDEAGGHEGLREEFERRHRAAGGPSGELEDDWQGYIDGIYGICLRSVSPETIVRKSQLAAAVGALLEQAAPTIGSGERGSAGRSTSWTRSSASSVRTMTASASTARPRATC